MGANGAARHARLVSALGWLAACAQEEPAPIPTEIDACLQTPHLAPWLTHTDLTPLQACLTLPTDGSCPAGNTPFPWDGPEPTNSCFDGTLACVLAGPHLIEAPDTWGSAEQVCCYDVLWHWGDGICGRPLLDEAGRPALAPTVHAAAGWRGPAVADLPAAAAGLWARDAAMEHASIASFAQLALDLMAHGAPARLLEGAVAAMADEVRHAQAAYALASGVGAVGPGPLVVPSLAVPSLVALATATVRDGVVNESLAAAVAAARLAGATDPAVVAALRAVVDDEARHAALAWQIVAWACEVGGPEVQAACDQELAEALQRAAHAEVDNEPYLPAWGLCGAVAVARARRVAIGALRLDA